jgi:hypothetical protein
VRRLGVELDEPQMFGPRMDRDEAVTNRECSMIRPRTRRRIYAAGVIV